MCSVLLFNVLMMLSTYMEATASARLFLYGACLAAIDRSVDPLILFWKSSDLRKGLKCFIGLTNQVETLNSLPKVSNGQLNAI